MGTELTKWLVIFLSTCTCMYKVPHESFVHEMKDGHEYIRLNLILYIQKGR